MVTVEQLYKDFGVLADAKDKAGEHPDEFKSILSAVSKGGLSEKRLASQFLARFFKHFPDLALTTIDAQLDLCEDEDASIRKQAIKDLPSFCKENQDHLPRIADVLTQLLQTDDTTELSVVQSSLLALFKYDAKATFAGVFVQISSGEDVVRERAIKFLKNKVKSLPEGALTDEVEEFFIAESKKVLQDVTGDEFLAFIGMLSNLKSMNTLKGRQTMVEIVTEQADLNQPFVPSDPDAVDRLIQCVKQALPFFSKNVHTTEFLGYMLDHVLPVLSEVQAHVVETPEGEDPPPPPDVQLDLLKLVSEMAPNAGPVLAEPHTDRLDKLYTTLIEYMPLPKEETENGENSSASEAPKLQFSYVECLMFTFHQLCAKQTTFLTDTEHADRLKDFRLRLQYFARGVQLYIKQLRMSLQGKTNEALKSEENKLKLLALRVTNNINLLIKDLFHNPPSFKTIVQLSWKPHTQKKEPAVSPGTKRGSITPITYDGESPAKKERKPSTGDGQGRKLYSPPTGKWSENAGATGKWSENTGAYRGGNRGGGRGGFRGGFRGGRGRGRGGGRGFRRGGRW